MLTLLYDRSDCTIPASPGPAHRAGRSRQGRVHVDFTVSSLQSCVLVRNNTAGLSAQGHPEKKRRERELDGEAGREKNRQCVCPCINNLVIVD